MADVQSSTDSSQEQSNSMVVLSQSPGSEFVDELSSQNNPKEAKETPDKENVTQDVKAPESPTDSIPVEEPATDTEPEATTIEDVHSVVLEGINTVKILQYPNGSSKRRPRLPLIRRRRHHNKRSDAEDSSSGYESTSLDERAPPRRGAPPGQQKRTAEKQRENEEDAKDDSKIRFTIECEDYNGYFSNRYQKNRPSKDVDILSRVRELNSKAPVIEQVIAFRYKQDKSLYPGILQTAPLSEMNEDDVLSVRLVIHSPLLLNAFRAVVQYYSGESLNGSQLNISHPYAFAFHHRDQLKMYKGSPRPEHTKEYNEECDKHIDIFLMYLEKYTGLRMEEEEARWERKLPTATFQNLWLLLKPGEDVYAVDESGNINAFVVKSVEGSGFSGRSQIPAPYIVKLWRMDFDGKWIGRSTKIFTIQPFEGEREITKLDVFPIRFYSDQPGDVPLRDRLIARGKKFFAITKGPAYREYNGFTHSTPRRKYNRARIMIDNRYEPWRRDPKGRAHAPNLTARIPNLTSHASNPAPRGAPRPSRLAPPPPPPPRYLEDEDQDQDVDNPFVPGCRCAKCEENNEQVFSIPKVKFHDYDYINPREITCLSDHQLSLCPPQIYGYVLKDRHWHLLEVDQIEQPNINEKAIDWLVMSDESDKNMIKAICQQYTSRVENNESFTPDIIDGKGEGQIFLLHGPPGTGKTLTAECVAEFTRRPLISITAGDLGSNPVYLERNLEEFFRQGTDWDAIVLLDEADVYLEARTPHDLERNSIVSVFLRSLEYYQGILFITTNRIGTFDEAFASRIHVQLHYKALDEKARASVWDNNFHKLKEEGHRGGQRVDVDRDAKDYIKRGKDVKDLAWNGREIRNAFQTATALAVYEAKEGEIPLLKEEHLAKVVQMSAAFKKYVKDMYKMTNEERAQLSQIRARDGSTAPERSLGAGYH